VKFCPKKQHIAKESHALCHKQNRTKQGVCHIVALPFTLKKYLKAKEELWKFKYFTMQKYNLQKHSLQETKILQDILIL
jgi:hypothetical protein